MSTEARTPTFATRLAEAVLPLCVSVFLGAMTVGVVIAGTTGELTLDAVLIVVFIVTVMGGIACWSGAIAFQALRGTSQGDAALAAPPPELVARCPACGTTLAASAMSCVECRHPLPRLAERWTGEPRSRIATGLLLCLGPGLIALGAFIGLGPIFEQQAWAGQGRRRARAPTRARRIVRSCT